MKLNIVKIGNSLGIRLPKSLIDQCKFKAIVVVKVEDGNLVLRADDSENPRSGWDEAFKKMAKAGDDKLIAPELSDLPSDTKDWKW